MKRKKTSGAKQPAPAKKRAAPSKRSKTKKPNETTSSPKQDSRFYDVPCHFCGEDHHPSHCGTLLCAKCNRLAGECECPEPDEMLGADLYEQIAEYFWEMIPEELADEAEAQVEKEGLLRTLCYVGKKYPEAFPKWFTKVGKGAKKQPEKASQQYGSCYEHAFGTLIGMPEYAGAVDALGASPASMRLVHGYPTAAGSDGRMRKIGHAWLELTVKGEKSVLDCGTTEFTPKLWSAKDYYRQLQVRSSECRRYTKLQAQKHFEEQNTWGPWEEPPTDAEVVGYR